MSVNIDLHTHTYRSGDSTTTVSEYVEAFEASSLSMVAVTDHLTIDGALEIQERLGSQCIVGQETKTDIGEVIGLFLTDPLPPRRRFEQTCELIHQQGGLVYLPHPGDQRRSSVSLSKLPELLDKGLIDILEYGNAKIDDPLAMEQVKELGLNYHTPLASSSDSHVPGSLGSCYSEISKAPRCPRELLRLLGDANLIWSYCDPPRPWSPRIVPSHHRS